MCVEAQLLSVAKRESIWTYSFLEAFELLWRARLDYSVEVVQCKHEVGVVYVVIILT